MGRAGRSSMDLHHHLQAASRAFLAHKRILCDRKVRLKERLRFFDRVNTLVVVFSVGHRTLYQSDLCHMDVML